MHEISCPFCNRYYRQAVIEENGYCGVRCPACQVIYISPRPPWADILKMYASKASRPIKSLKAGTTAKRLKAEHTLSLVRSHISGKTALEIGPGAGFFLQVLRRQGFTVYGIELNGQLADFLNRTLNIPCDRRPLSVSSFGGETFDLIYHCDVLSHLYNPLADLPIMRAKLKDGGLLVFETGNLGEVQSRYYHWYPSFRYPEHLFFFGEKSLRLLLARTGFELVSLHRYPLRYVLLLEKFHHFLSKAPAPDGPEPASRFLPLPKTTGPALKRTVKRTLGLLYDYVTEYFLPYRLGPFVSRLRAGQPQTLIVVARKAQEGAASS